jgi:hypothetical protein
MPIYRPTNAYPGVNPHLNSRLQQRGGGWKAFHTAYLNALYEMLDERLPPGYSATPEDSLQIRVYDPKMDGYPTLRQVGPDILIRRSGTVSSVALVPEEAVAPTTTLAMLPVEMVEDDELVAVVVYQNARPVTRLELLSPANKPGGSHQTRYERNRLDLARQGIRLVEIDLLHELPPMLEDLPSYPDRQDGAWPYSINVIDPHPTFEKGRIDIYGFGVIDKLPIIDVPLENGDSVRVNFGKLYDRVLSRRNFYEQIDYAQEPFNMTAYAEADQVAIRSQMKHIADSDASP